MGLFKSEEQLEASKDSDELLPQHDTSTHVAPALLEPTATPDEVRSFLSQILRNRGIASDYAERIASRWTLGTGKELRSYPVAMFRQIFGPDEEGWMVYMAVRVPFYKKDCENDLSQKQRGE